MTHFRVLLALVLGTVSDLGIKAAEAYEIKQETLCSVSPDNSDARLSQELYGALRRDANGEIHVSIWKNHGKGDQLVRHYVENDLIRLVFSRSPFSSTQEGFCESSKKAETRIAIIGLTSDRTYRLQAEYLLETRTLPGGASVEITAAVDCGGQIGNEARAADAVKAPLSIARFGDQVLKLTVYAQHGGTAMDPKFVMKGNVIEAGYVERTINPAPACLFSDRINFLVKGPLPNDVSVTLISNRLNYGQHAISALLLLVLVAYLAKYWRRRNSRDSANREGGIRP